MAYGCNYSTTAETKFRVWAPNCDHLELKIYQPSQQRLAMTRQANGYWQAEVTALPANSRYTFVLPGEIERPDPASHFQPEGVHGPSQVIDHEQFSWKDASWQGVPLSDMIIYELHVGTFTPTGTFEAVIERLTDLMDLGINTIEIMPVAAFPGQRNWGYDGVGLYAVQNNYGGPIGLKKLVNACHQRGLAVLLDVVYNHLGPEGNYLREFAPYFTNKYQTPWGEALNFDDAHSDEVRTYFIQNALHWLEHYHIDGLRLDAVHAITDMSAKPFLAELAEAVSHYSSSAGREHYLIAESDLNDSRLIKPPKMNGYGLHATWHDDFHHALHALLTGERQGYYQDFGQLNHLAKALESGYVYDGCFSNYRKRRHGNQSIDCPVRQFVVCGQNHDQVGNRLLAERLAKLVTFDQLKLAAATLLFSPYIPMLFMGEEYGEDNPFYYFVDHGDQGLLEAVREGRKQEFCAFNWQGELPDPGSQVVFSQCVLDWDKRQTGQHHQIWQFYRSCLFLRRTLPAFQYPDRMRYRVTADEGRGLILQQRWYGSARALIVLNYSEEKQALASSEISGVWEKVIDAQAPEFGGRQLLAPEVLNQAEQLVIEPYGVLVYQQQGH